MTVERTRTFSWADPSITANAAMSMQGLEFLAAMASGALPLPPIMAALDIVGVEAAPGRVTFAFTPAEYHYNPIGTVHGGVISTIADTAMACAIHTTLPPATGYATLELKVNFVRPITIATGRITCVGTVIHSGARVATAEARLTDEASKLYAHATTTCMILK